MIWTTVFRHFRKYIARGNLTVKSLENTEIVFKSKTNCRLLTPIKRDYSDTLGFKTEPKMNIIKSANDKREYRVIKLDNGLTSLLISNPPGPGGYLDTSQDDEDSGSEEDEEMSGVSSGEDDENEEEIDCDEASSKKKPGERKSAAALCIGNGSFSDPDHIPGFAHFLEHMVFMGSKKYPKENELDDYLSKHGGYSNAWTDCERTLFYFEVQGKNFGKSLDMFANFFISPLLLEDCVNREVQAVDSEFQMAVPRDDDRIDQLIRSTAQQNHPISKFLFGNLKTLKLEPEQQGINIYDDLRDFYNKMYSAHYMTLALESTHSLDTMEKFVRDSFSTVPNNGRPKQTFTQDPFKTQEFTKFYKVSSVETTHSLDITWFIEPLLHTYRSKPLEYVSTLVAHEGKGSILSYLKHRTLALALSGGTSYNGTDLNTTCTCFSINITLTDKGLQDVYQVLTVIFQYIHLLQTTEVDKRIYNELKIIEDTKFRWKELGEAIDYVETMSENMQMFPEEHYLTGRRLLYDFDKKLISECIKQLQPTTANIILRTKSFDDSGILNCEEKWFGTKYCVEDIDPEWMKKWQDVEINKDLFLPDPNRFIVTNFDLSQEPATQHPELFLQDNGCQFWFKKDAKFNIPKGCVFVKLSSPVVCRSLNDSVLCDLFISLLQHNLTEAVYPAILAGYEYVLESFTTGIFLQVDGFNHKLPLFLETILDHIVNFNCDSEVFTAVQLQLKKEYYNEMIKPYDLAKILEMSILDPNCHPITDQYHHITRVTQEMLYKFIEEFRSNLYIDSFTYGNFNKQEVINMASLIKSKLRLSENPSLPKPKRCYRKLEEETRYCRVKGINNDDLNTCVLSYHQAVPGNIYHSVLNELLVSRMREPCFDILRTKHQLGYSVGAVGRNNHGVLGLQIYVKSQADKFSLSTIDDHINSFLQEFNTILTNLSAEDFRDAVSSLMTEKLLEEVTVEDESIKLWGEIAKGSYVFDRKQKEVEILEKISHKELLDWFSQYINNTHGRLSIQVEGKTEDSSDSNQVDGLIVCDNGLTFKGQGEPSRTFITDIKNYKKTLTTYPYTPITS